MTYPPDTRCSVLSSRKELVIKNGTCYHDDMQKELDGFTVGTNHLNLNKKKGENFILKVAEVNLNDVECTCKGNNMQPSAKKILPTADNTKDIVVYNSCRRTLLLSLIHI